MNFVIQHSYLIPLLPLIGAAIAGFLGARWLKQNSHWPIWIGVGASAVLSIILLIGAVGEVGHHESAALSEPAGASTSHLFGWWKTQHLFTWIQAGDFRADAGFWFDPLTAVMLCVVCGIGFFITVFAAGYMKGEAGYFRFFAYLGLFIFMMTNLVMGENLIMLYLGWEGVGLCSYLLIGYYYEKPSAREAAKKAFLVNRVGDFGFGIGIMLTYYVFGTVSYFGDPHAGVSGFMQMAADMTAAGISPEKQQLVWWIPFCLMLGAFGKSAQFPLHVWLPDAMEGPTPVSALIHAATMVTAGVYMIARCSVVFALNVSALDTVAVIGMFTALMAATIALRQFDLKKVFAYSTVSQLGFMFVAVGVLAPVAGVFHLVTHAFFKALLFLSSGVVMHAMLGHLDMRRMSGLKHVLPKTRWLMLIGCLALAGVPPLAGFWSKDEIIAAAQHRNALIGIILLLTAFLTAYYTFRLYFRVFEGPLVQPTEPAEGHHGHADDHGHGHAEAHDHAADHAHDHHNHEPAVMILPLVVLALGALLSGVLLGPTHALAHFLAESPSFKVGHQVADRVIGAMLPPERRDELAANFGQAPAHHGVAPLIVGTLVALAGIGLAYLLHLRDRARAERLAAGAPALTRMLEAKYWLDEIYQAGIVEPLRAIGRAFFAIDRWVVDGLVNTVAFIPWVGGAFLKLAVQRGYLQGYAAAMLFGVVVILLVVFL